MQEPALPVKPRPTGNNAEEIRESKETIKTLHEIRLKKHDRRIDNLGKNAQKIRSIIHDQLRPSP